MMIHGLKVVAVIALLIVAQDKDEKVDTDAQSQIKSMSWLAGDWSGAMWGGTFHAYYTTPEGGKVISYSTLMRDGEQKFYEFEVFDVVDGKVVFIRFPEGSS